MAKSRMLGLVECLPVYEAQHLDGIYRKTTQALTLRTFKLT